MDSTEPLKDCVIELSYGEWTDMLRRIGTKGRKKFPAIFHETLSFKLQKKGIKCWLKCR
jgi:hypothetical protein